MKKGITLVTLTTVVVVMVILLTTVTISGINAVNNSKKMKFASELVFVQEAVQEYKTLNYEKLPVNSTDITDSNLPSGQYNEINLDMIGLLDTTYGRRLKGDAKDIYVLSKTNGEVYYQKGLKIGNTTYYNLTDELKNMIDYTNKDVVKDGIKFTQSNYDYTNQAIKLSVQVPTSYTSVAVLSQGATVSMTTTTGGYYVYEITKSSNFDAVVTYKNANGASQKQVYTVTNFDNVSPTIQITNRTVIAEKNETNITIATNDNLSGVDKILYAEENVSKAYFETEKKGKVVTNNNVSIDKLVDYVTFYVVDKAGNSKILLETMSKTLATTEDEYSKYGLVLHYDGINNTGDGHSTTTNVWKDLSGHGNNATLEANITNGTVSGNGWDNDSVNIMKATPSNTGRIIQDTKFTDMKSFTIELKGNFEPNTASSTWTRILSTNGYYSDVYEGINGIDLTYIDLDKNIYSFISNGIIENYTRIGGIQKSSSITIVWDYNERKLHFYTNGKLNKSVNISLPNINCEQIAIDHARVQNSTGNYSYNSVRVYNRVLTADEIAEHYKIDVRRFGK